MFGLFTRFLVGCGLVVVVLDMLSFGLENTLIMLAIVFDYGCNCALKHWLQE